jgi:septal ring factor EnvC (AmiA/AmiB activator)
MEMYVGVLGPVLWCIMNLLREVNMMDEKRLDRMEDMLATLIGMVGNLNQQQQTMQADLNVVKADLIDVKADLNVVKADLNDVKIDLNIAKADLQVVKVDQTTLRCENEKQFSEVMKKLTYMQADQDYIWDKTVKNERELANLRSQLQL